MDLKGIFSRKEALPLEGIQTIGLRCPGRRAGTVTRHGSVLCCGVPHAARHPRGQPREQPMSSSDRMLAVLSLFSIEQSEITVEGAAAALGSPLRTTYRHVRSLAAAGLLAPLHGGRYVLGPAAVQMDWLIRNTDPLTNVAAPALAILERAVEVPAVILLCRLYRSQVMCVSQATTGHPPFASSYQRGRPMPLFRGAASKAILAALPKRAVKAFHASHATEMAAAGLGGCWSDVVAALDRIRADGVCVTSGEIDPGLTGMAAPVTGSEIMPVGSLALVIANTKLNAKVAARCARLLRAAAEQATASLRAL